jgi:hypothetical protein
MNGRKGWKYNLLVNCCEENTPDIHIGVFSDIRAVAFLITTKNELDGKSV